MLGSGRESDPGPGDDAAGERPRCSAKGCRAAATTDLSWRNPTLHAAGRVKHWLACDEHDEHLADFLARRGFLLDRGPLAAGGD
ncbi:hypothetical protein SAMN05443575_2923 [Jatrophihabitans endophyticus]|uniref:Acetone carboxylase n=1 Tax=Jatrophihabitans endophyticus TaxID=1206085 RepID=A0A1M5N5L7_9ACTN|nr:hypothetical protein SAMN05443575_2923 [Jatrophihabitans endophyticus]